MKRRPARRSSSRSPGRRSGRKKAERPLLCTLGAKAKTRAMFPRDSLCTYLVYTHLTNDAAGFMRPRNSPAFELFQDVARASRHTEFGASLDYASVLKSKNRTNPKHVKRLAELQSSNIIHYGVLNFVLPDELDNGVKASLDVLKVFKKYLKTRHRSSKKSHHVMLGMKFENVNQEDSSKQYVDKVDEVLQAFPITMLVLITHVTSFPDKTDQLTGGAPWRVPASANYLSVEYGCKILREASIPKKVTAMVSFTMAVSEFRVKEAWTPDLGTKVEAEQMKLVPFCKTQVPEYSTRFVKKTQGFQVAGNKASHTVAVFDTEETLGRKVNYSLRVSDHLPSGIAAFNVEYDDYNKHCSNGFHQRLGAIKHWL